MTASIEADRSLSKGTLLLDASAIWLCLISIYQLTFSGVFHVDDEHILASRAQSLAFWGDLNFTQVYGNERVRHLSIVPHPSAPPVVAIEPGQAVLGALLFRFASNYDVGGAQAFLSLNSYATALTGALVYLISRSLDFRRLSAAACALLYGLGSMAWPYAKTGFRDPLSAMMVTLSFLGWVLLRRPLGQSKIIGIVILSSGMVFGVLIKSNVLVFLVAFFIAGMLAIFQHKPMMRSWKSWLFLALPWILLAIVALCMPQQGPFSRYALSHFIDLAQRYRHGLGLATVAAAFGPFLSPAKSILLFNPLLLLLPFAILPAWRRMSSFCLPVLLGVLFLALAQAFHLREEWAGPLFWGLRHMLPAVPLLMILIIPLAEGLMSSSRPWLKGILGLLVLASLAVQWAGSVVDWSTPFLIWQARGLNPYHLQAVWDPRFQVIPIHLSALLDPWSWDVAWVRVLAFNRWALIIPLFSLVFFLTGLVILLLMRRRDLLSKIMASAVLLLGLIAPLYPNLSLLRQDPQAGGGRGELAELVAWAEEQVISGDLVVVDGYASPLWYRMMNDWSAPVPWYSLPFEIPGIAGAGSDIGTEPSQAALQLFGEVGSKHDRLLYLTSQDVPDDGLLREETWLKENLMLLHEQRFMGKVLAHAMILARAETIFRLW